MYQYIETLIQKEWLNKLRFQLTKKLAKDKDYEHNRIDNNAEAHLLSGLIGQSKIIPIKDNNLVLGTWQQIFLVELDGPRERKIVIHFLD